jgi:hypothetical protein
MVLVIALTVWALAALPIAIALGRLCAHGGNTQPRRARGEKTADVRPLSQHTV